MTPTDKPVRVEALHFVAAITIGSTGLCNMAPPILAWCIGHTEQYLSAYFRSKGWSATVRPNLLARPWLARYMGTQSEQKMITGSGKTQIETNDEK